MFKYLVLIINNKYLIKFNLIFLIRTKIIINFGYLFKKKIKNNK